jgi:hypothetical protein
MAVQIGFPRWDSIRRMSGRGVQASAAAGVAVTPEQLKTVPYVLEFGPRLSALPGSEDWQER